MLRVGFVRPRDRRRAPVSGTRRPLQAAVDAAFKVLSWDDIVESMNAHPRIGDRVRRRRMVGGRAVGRRVGQRPGVRQALAEGNAAYEQRFGHVFLICASGLSGQDMLDQLRARLGNDPDGRTGRGARGTA